MMNSIKIITVVLLMLIFGTGIARADTGVPAVHGVNLLASPVPMGDPAVETERDIVELRDLFEIAFEMNPQISAARSQWQATVEMYPQVTSLPDPKLNVSWFPEPIETRNGSNDFGVQLMQMIPNPRRLDLMGDMVLTRAGMAEVRYELTVRDVLADVMTSYFELGYLYRAFEIARINTDLFGQLVEFGNLRYAQNEIGASELYSAESRLGQAEYESMLLLELRFSEESRLRSLLGVDPDTEIGDVILPRFETVHFDLDSLRERVLEYRHELEMAGVSVEMAELNVSIARSLDDPDYSVGLMYNFIGTSPMSDGMRTNGDDAWGIMLGVTIPIW
jgi:outer membrane protein TolC